MEVNRYPTIPEKSLRFVDGFTIKLVAAERGQRLIVSIVNAMCAVFNGFILCFLLGFVGKFESGGVKELDALGELGHGFEPVVGILDANHCGLDVVAVEFLEKLAGFSGASAPGDVVAIFSFFVEVVHLDGDDAIF